MSERIGDCPKCSVPLVPRYAKGKNPAAPAQVSFCESCRGVFVDREALAVLGLPGWLASVPSEEDGEGRCPRCELVFQSLEVSGGKLLDFGQVDIDRCPSCKGLFFDFGELSRVAGRTVSVAQESDDEYLKNDPKRVSSRLDEVPWESMTQEQLFHEVMQAVVDATTTPVDPDSLRACPGCSCRLSDAQVAGSRADDEVPIKRCAFCSGIFADHEKVQRILGLPFSLESEERGTDRRCAFCKEVMSAFQLVGVPVEACGMCDCVYFDDGELQKLAARPLRFKEVT